jgi:diguanylate cyclase (GGDEF)-like protein
MRGMNGRTKRILGRTLLIIVPAVVSAFAISFSIRLALKMEIDWLSWIECVMIPVLVGTPIGIYIFSQAEKLQSAHERLERTHQAMCKAHDRLAFMASHDQMTGLLNRDGFLRTVEPYRTGNEGHVLLIADADYFKRINDRYGHSKGDEALVKIAQALRYAVREKDVVGRIGGEEFAILLVSVGMREAMRMAELIRLQVQCIPWHVEGPQMPGLSISIGGAALERRHATIAETIREADRNLYEAKRLGRNRVVFGEAGTPTATAAA